MRKSPALQVEEISGDRYADLKSAQEAALPSIADGIAVSMRRMLSEGWLIVENGQIVPNPARVHKTDAGWQIIPAQKGQTANEL